jgi:hypothetical protein
MMSSWKDQGCAVCRQLWRSGQRPEELAVNIQLHARLFQCGVCGSYWEENERYAVVIPEPTVRADYPGVLERKNK